MRSVQPNKLWRPKRRLRRHKKTKSKITLPTNLILDIQAWLISISLQDGKGRFEWLLYSTESETYCATSSAMELPSMCLTRRKISTLHSLIVDLERRKLSVWISCGLATQQTRFYCLGKAWCWFVFFIRWFLRRISWPSKILANFFTFSLLSLQFVGFLESTYLYN